MTFTPLRIAVTGGNGKLGRAAVAGLRAAGHTVIVLDMAGPDRTQFTYVDLTDYGQVVDALAGVNGRHDGVDAVAHLGAIPAPGLWSDVATFQNNMNATFNVFQACKRLGIKTIAYASSETVLGLPFETPPPYIPLDEEYETRPESTYSMVKHLEEEMAQKFVRWDPTLTITALRFSNVMDPADYAEFPSFDADARQRSWNLWGYIDARDGANAIRLALETSRPGYDVFNIFAADTVMSRPNAELVAEVFPGVEVRGELGVNASLTSIAKAERLLGWVPQHSWRD
ncbi:MULTISPECIES: NAD(P)-dependent oxidoreductase [unclassified Salinibacterium]|uniref:NAD-dependent epimerase/dehydratase family protein n=1 Tax=unclassified Salinibacterium TaxID=2632331 RepID=UPI0018CF673C|nr:MULTISPECIES: NAD(P)-dependent oxidoreductase [unclassified Salinibacterium]MBH0053417.1 NAD(P)-dependent oxidoreductase [Salinibacterium sp. SWN139]MBH0082685.1 NAD(P)-dependent oxidoreductase [Salinibacterium sp. SWN167]